MENISYFCIVKLFKRNIRYTLAAFFLLLTGACNASATGADSQLQTDSIEVSLLTCMPRPYIYSLYGHTAIRFTDKAHGTDLAINYGMFSFDKPYFVLRFVFGLTDYEMGIEYFEYFKRQYEMAGCGVIQQTLNLTHDEKVAIAEAIEQNYLPANRVYRYNYFYDNCTTRARDILTDNIKGKVTYPTHDDHLSFRQMIRQYNGRHLWARFGNDLLLGVAADRNTTPSERQFLPDNLRRDFAHATITDEHGNVRPLVKATSWATPAITDSGAEDFPVSPRMLMAILAIVVAMATLAESLRKSNYWLLDTALMAASGLCGIILFAMVFSQHPTVRLNLQILLLNPLSLLLIWPTAKSLRQGRAALWMKIWTVCIILFIAGATIQSYAEGMLILACSLLFRNIIRIRLTANRKQNK